MNSGRRHTNKYINDVLAVKHRQMHGKANNQNLRKTNVLAGHQKGELDEEQRMAHPFAARGNQYQTYELH